MKVRSLKGFLMFLGTLFSTFLPRWSAILLAKILGRLCFWLMVKQRVRMVRNYQIFFGEELKKKEAQVLVKRLFVKLGVVVADFLRTPILKKERLFSLIDEENKALFETKEKKNFILATPHLGNWEMGGIALAQKGVDLAVLVEVLPSGLTYVYNWYRKRAGLIPIPYNQLKKTIKFLKNGRSLAILSDRALNRQGVLLSFGKGKRIFPRGPAFLALKYKVPLYFAYFVLDERNKRYQMVIKPIKTEFEDYNEKDFDIEVNRLTGLITQMTEEVVKKYPDQWFVFQADWVRE